MEDWSRRRRRRRTPLPALNIDIILSSFDSAYATENSQIFASEIRACFFEWLASLLHLDIM